MSPRRTRSVSEKGLRGAWWRCPTHGLTTEPIILGEVSYCAADGCDMRAPLVHSAMDDGLGGKEAWNEQGAHHER